MELAKQDLSGIRECQNAIEIWIEGAMVSMQHVSMKSSPNSFSDPPGLNHGIRNFMTSNSTFCQMLSFLSLYYGGLKQNASLDCPQLPFFWGGGGGCSD